MSTQADWSGVDRYLSGKLLPDDPLLSAVLEANAAAGLPQHDVSPLQGKFLSILARLVGARRVLEIGTLGGYSTIWLARALPDDGCLVTLESDEHRAEIARGNIVRAGLSEKVKIRVGPALDTLPRLKAEGHGPFDLVFIDADKRSNPAYLQWSISMARPGTVIIGDNVVRSGTVLDGASVDPSVLGIQGFFDMLAAEPKVTATALQTVGLKGWDGFAIAIVE